MKTYNRYLALEYQFTASGFVTWNAHECGADYVSDLFNKTEYNNVTFSITFSDIARVGLRYIEDSIVFDYVHG